MFHFFLKKQQAFGLDIGAVSIKALQLGHTSKGFRVRELSQAPLPKGVVVNDSIVDAKTFGYVLKQVLEKPRLSGFNTKHAVVNLPETKSFVRVIQIPKMSESDAANAIPFEAENFIPLPVDQVYLDWQILGMVGDKMNILIIASPKEYVDMHLDILDKAGITTVALEVESQSCHRSLIQKGNTETVLIVDMAASRTNMIMVEDGHLQFTSTIPVAGDSFTESIARGLGISAIKAEAVKQKVGVANTSEYPNIKILLIPILSSLVAEIKNILKFHNEHSATPVTRIIFSGGGAKLKNVIEYLSAEFSDVPGMQLSLANPWVNLSPLIQNSPDPYGALDLSTVIGLAMRGIEDIY
jgi:type IV pilus assembly protein PilM